MLSFKVSFVLFGHEKQRELDYLVCPKKKKGGKKSFILFYFVLCGGPCHLPSCTQSSGILFSSENGWFIHSWRHCQHYTCEFGFLHTAALMCRQLVRWSESLTRDGSDPFHLPGLDLSSAVKFCCRYRLCCSSSGLPWWTHCAAGCSGRCWFTPRPLLPAPGRVRPPAPPPPPSPPPRLQVMMAEL